MSSTSETLLLTSLSKYFNQRKDYCKQFKSIVDGTHPISLRVIDWFVTHYAKQKNVLYYVHTQHDELMQHFDPKDANHLKKFHLYLEYRAQLKSYTKYYFDPFRRHERISFVLNENPLETVETTVGQLNFFRWALQNHVIDYIQANLTDIDESMYEFQVKKKEGIVSKAAPAPSFSKSSSQVTTDETCSTSAGGIQQFSVQCQLRFD